MSQDPEVVEPKETGNVKRTVVEPKSPEEGLQSKSSHVTEVVFSFLRRLANKKFMM